MKKLKQFYYNLAFHKKLVIGFLIVSLLPTVVIGTYSFSTSMRSANRRYENDMLFDLRNTADSVAALRQDIELRIIRLTNGSDVVRILSENPERSAYITREFQLKKILYDFDFTSVLDSVYIFDQSGHVYTNQSTQTYLDAILRLLQERGAELDHRAAFWGELLEANGEYVLPYVRTIKDYHTGRLLGVAVANLSERSIASLAGERARTADNVLLVAQNGSILSSWDKTLLGGDFQTLYGTEPPLDSRPFQGVLSPGGALAKKFLLLSYQPTGEWRYVSAVAEGKVSAASRSIMAVTSVILLLCVASCAVLSIFLSKNITKPIDKLIGIMDRVEGNDLSVDFVPLYNDEIGRLTRSFNQMTLRLKASIDDMLEAQRRYRQAEYQALTAQINPHFLYNTLSSIIWLTNSGYSEEVIRMVSALSSLFRISISKGREKIPIRDELEHVKSYLEIQQIRYQSQFQFAIDVEMAILGFYTPKIILQPLVENAIYHGIRDSGKEGVIRILGRREGGDLVLEVRDTGGQVTEEELLQLNRYLNDEPAEEKERGIGLKNVHDRIRFHFREARYGVSLYRDGTETVARVVLKAEEAEDGISHSDL